MSGSKTNPPLVLLVFLAGALSAPAVVRLSCDVTPLPGGLYEYKLSPGPGPDCDDQGWEDHKKTALTSGCKFAPDLVHSLTNQTLVLKKCLDFTHFTAQCPGFVEANCNFDCSSVRSDLDAVTPPQNGSEVVKRPNNVCFGDKCFDLTHFAITCSAIPLVMILLIIAGLCAFSKWKKHRGERDLQHKAMELGEIPKEKVVLLGTESAIEEVKPLSDQTKPDAPDNALLSAVHVD